MYFLQSQKLYRGTITKHAKILEYLQYLFHKRSLIGHRLIKNTFQLKCFCRFSFKCFSRFSCCLFHNSSCSWIPSRCCFFSRVAFIWGFGDCSCWCRLTFLFCSYMVVLLSGVPKIFTTIIASHYRFVSVAIRYMIQI